MVPQMVELKVGKWVKSKGIVTVDMRAMKMG